MQIQVRLFATLREILGRNEMKLNVPHAATIATAWEMLVTAHPELDTGITLAFAINRTYAEPNQILHDGDELALIPPVSGG